MEKMYVTIVGQEHYLGTNPYKIGRVVKLVKDDENEHDQNAIKVVLPYIDTIGYVANSLHTVYKGTFSASRLYDKIQKETYARIMFITHSAAIAEVIDKSEAEKFGYPVNFDLIKETVTDDN